LVWIEIASLGIRPLALGIRLIANITAGHLLLHLFSLRSIGRLGLLIGALFFFIVLLELRVAVIQAYVFSLLLSLYINERLE
jgi:F0F1-type ATP synthase membrane subunit a